MFIGGFMWVLCYELTVMLTLSSLRVVGYLDRIIALGPIIL